MNSLSIRDNQYYKLKYSHDEVDKLALPSSILIIEINLILNGNKITVLNNEEIIFDFAAKFKKFWQLLNYETTLDINERNDNSIVLNCRCNAFSERVPNQLSKLYLELSCFTDESCIEYDDMLENWDYLLSSWLLHIEQELPFCFSVIGRNYSKMNLFWYKKVTTEIFEQDYDLIRVLEILYDNIIEKYTVRKLLTISGKLPSMSDKTKTVVKSYPVRILRPTSED